MSEAGTTTQDYEKFLTQESSNYDDTGFFSIQVLQKSLASWNLELIPFTSQNEYAQNARLNPIDEQAFICNFKHHWYSIRKIASYWFNLNSLLKRPELISDTYLSVLLAQLQSDGYAIFIVKGDLPKTQAESKLAENPLNVKEILSSYNKKRNKISSNSSADVFDDDELKKAIKMSSESTRDDIKLAVIQNDLTYIKEKMNAIDNKVSSGYVSKEEFEPIKKIVYGVVSLILIAVVGALVALVISGSK